MINSLYENFKHWSSQGSVWIISDPHFNDEDCKFMRPDWPEPEQYVKQLNKVIGKQDTLICLGDVGEVSFIGLIKCQNKVLITGNHDKGISNYKEYFNEIYDGPLFIADRILLSHEPIFGLEDFCVNIHGHCHNGQHRYDGHINLAADVVDFQPFNLGQAIKDGILSGVPNYHRNTIDWATEHSIHKKDLTN